jgi:hypothetical protein
MPKPSQFTLAKTSFKTRVVVEGFWIVLKVTGIRA